MWKDAEIDPFRQLSFDDRKLNVASCIHNCIANRVSDVYGSAEQSASVWFRKRVAFILG